MRTSRGAVLVFRSFTGEPLLPPLPGLPCLHITIARRRVCVQRANQSLGSGRDFFDGLIEYLFVRVGWLRRAAQLANKLQRGGANLVVGRGRSKVRQRFDVSTHYPFHS